MKKLFAVMLALCLTLCLAAGSALADFGRLNTQPQSTELSRVDDPENYAVTGQNGRVWTVMIYMSGTNLESEGFASCATNDMREMVGADYDQSQMTVLLLAGGATRWKNNAIDVDDHAIYELVGDTFVKRQSLGKTASLGNPATLTTLMDYGYANYPADHYALVMWDHGGGPNGGAIHDDNNIVYTAGGNPVSDWLTSDEIVEGLSSSFAANRKLELFAWHACLMGTLEVACMLAPYFDYMCCSEEVMCSAEDLNYAFFKNLPKCSNGYEAGNLVIEAMMAQCAENYGADYGRYPTVLTESLIDLSKIPMLTQTVDDFFAVAADQMTESSYAGAARIRNGLYTFSFSEASFDMVDLRELVLANRDLAPQKADAVLEALDAVVCRNWLINIDPSKAGGLTVWYPLNSLTGMAERDLSVYESSFAPNYGFPTHYVSYIRSFTNLRASGGAVSTSNWTKLNGMSSDGNKANQTVYQLQLNETQANELMEHSIVVLTAVPNEAGEMTYAVVSSSATELDNMVVRGSYVNRGLFVLDAEGKPVNTVPLTWSERQVGSKTYVVTEVTLCDEEGNAVKAMLYCERAEDGALTVAFAKPYDATVGSYASASVMDAADFAAASADIACLLVNEETGISQWEVGQTVTVSWNMADCTLALVDDLVPLDTLYGAFELVDIYNNVHVALINGDAEDAVVIDCDDVYVRFNACDVRVSDGSLYITMTVANPTENEVAIEVTGMRLNDQAVDAGENWLEGNGPNEGIMPGESCTMTIAAPMDAIAADDALHAITMSLVVVDAADETELAVVPAMVSLTLPLN